MLYTRGLDSLFLIGRQRLSREIFEASGAVSGGAAAGVMGPFASSTAEALAAANLDCIVVLTAGLESVGGRAVGGAVRRPRPGGGGHGGFEGFELLRPVEGETRYFVYTPWRSEEDFRRWVNSEEFRRGRPRSNGGNPVTSRAALLAFEVVEWPVRQTLDERNTA